MIHDAKLAAAAPFEPGAYPRTYRFPGGVRLLLAVMAVAVATWMAIMSLRTRLVLHADGLDHRGAFVSRRIAVAQILGHRRVHDSRRGKMIDVDLRRRIGAALGTPAGMSV